MDFEQLEMDLDYNPEEQEDDGYDWIDTLEDYFYGDYEYDPD